MLFPKKVAHRKWQTGRKSLEKRSRPATRGITVAFGDFGLKATTPSRVRSNQIEAARRVISRTIGKTGQIWIRIFPVKHVAANSEDREQDQTSYTKKLHGFDRIPRSRTDVEVLRIPCTSHLKHVILEGLLMHSLSGVVPALGSAP